MIRESLVERRVGEERNIRWRGSEVSRIEGFSDAVFAFAITLLVVSLDVPETFGKLLETMQGFVAFAISFAMLLQVWFWHYRFFRRFGLQDTYTLVLNSILLFVVLLYVYPLKFLFTLVTLQFIDPASSKLKDMITADQSPQLMTIYGLGFAAVQGIFALLYFHAYRKRTDLELDVLERSHTKETIRTYLLIASVGLASVLIATIGGPAYTALAGYVYIAIAPIRTVQATIEGRQRRALEASVKPEA